jgi:nitrogen regulatory protein P-II 1
MKEVKAIMQPFLISKVVEALKLIPGLPGVTVSDVRGFGCAQAAGAANTVAEGAVEYVKKSKLEVVVPDELAEKVLETIQRYAHTGNPGDGKMFIYEVDDVVRIRTGERGEAAI